MLLITSTWSSAATLRKGAIICTTKDLLTQYLHAWETNPKDLRAILYLSITNRYCGWSQLSQHVTILTETWTGVYKVRIYSKGFTEIVWTPRKYVN